MCNIETGWWPLLQAPKRCWITLSLSRCEAFKYSQNKNAKYEWEYQDISHFCFIMCLEKNVEIIYWWCISEEEIGTACHCHPSCVPNGKEGNARKWNAVKGVHLIHLLNRNIQGKGKSSFCYFLDFACLNLHSHCLALVFIYKVIPVINLKLCIMFMKVKARLLLLLLLLLLFLKHQQTMTQVVLPVLCLYGPWRLMK